MPSLLPFALFAFVASITPGPSNILVMTNSLRHGWLATLPIILGACGGSALIVLLVGMGIGQSLARYPWVVAGMSWVGIAWLSYLAWQIFRSPAVVIATEQPEDAASRLGLSGAAGLQLVNPKVWTMALAVAGVFAGNDVERGTRIMLMSLIFFLVALPCMSAWALLGVGSSRWVRSPIAMQRFNQGMALLLLVSAWSSLLV